MVIIYRAYQDKSILIDITDNIIITNKVIMDKQQNFSDNCSHVKHVPSGHNGIRNSSAITIYAYPLICCIR